jgi:hypothetical protein
MKGLAGGVLVSLMCSAPLLAQERDRSFERISLALQQPLPIVPRVIDVQPAISKKVGFVTLVPATKPGEIIRVSIPIGELVMRAFRNVAAANQRRQEEAARREVEEALRLRQNRF